jgi:hypothetical protein
MILLLSFTAIVVDGGLLMDQRQRVQSAADLAALAAADKLFVNFPTYQGVDTPGTAKAAALASAAANGFPNPTVNIPPQSGPFAGLPGYAEVIVTYNQTRHFSKIFGSSDLPVVARAVSQGRWAAIKAGVMVLDPTGSGSLTATGGGTMTVAGVPIIIDSNSPTAAVATGGGTFVSPEFDIAGTPGIGGSGSWQGTVYSGQPPIPDPLAYLPEPDPSTMVVQSKNQTHIAGNQTTTIYPGVYNGGITVSGQGQLVMMPGIYYMNGGGFTFTGLGGLSAAGVMIVNNPQSNSDTISITGNGAINFSPPTSGIYQGISLWQTRSATNTIYVSGNGASSMSGTFYTAKGTLNVSGNGAGDVIGSQYISYNLVVNGGGSFAVNWNVNQTAKTRIINLVE